MIGFFGTIIQTTPPQKTNMKYKLVAFLFALSQVGPAFSAQKWIVEKDPLNRFSISHPASWYQQDRPSQSVRVMLGLEGDGYGGNCNVSVISSPSTARMSQTEIDASENRRPLSIDFFQRALAAVAKDVAVKTVDQSKRGNHFGHVVRYTYSYMSQAVGQRLFVNAELFSHSRAGKLFSFTCLVAALSEAEATSAFIREAGSFEALSTSLQVEPEKTGLDLYAESLARQAKALGRDQPWGSCIDPLLEKLHDGFNADHQIVGVSKLSERRTSLGRVYVLLAKRKTPSTNSVFECELSAEHEYISGRILR